MHDKYFNKEIECFFFLISKKHRALVHLQQKELQKHIYYKGFLLINFWPIVYVCMPIM